MRIVRGFVGHGSGRAVRRAPSRSAPSRDDRTSIGRTGVDAGSRSVTLHVTSTVGDHHRIGERHLQVLVRAGGEAQRAVAGARDRRMVRVPDAAPRLHVAVIAFELGERQGGVEVSQRLGAVLGRLPGGREQGFRTAEQQRTSRRRQQRGLRQRNDHQVSARPRRRVAIVSPQRAGNVLDHRQIPAAHARQVGNESKGMVQQGRARSPTSLVRRVEVDHAGVGAYIHHHRHQAARLHGVPVRARSQRRAQHARSAGHIDGRESTRERHSVVRQRDAAGHAQGARHRRGELAGPVPGADLIGDQAAEDAVHLVAANRRPKHRNPVHADSRPGAAAYSMFARNGTNRQSTPRVVCVALPRRRIVVITW